METGEGPPPSTVVTPETTDIPAPPYPGPPLDSSVVINQPTPNNQPVPQPVAQQHPQPSSQPVAQQYYQPVAQQHPQPSSQPVAQQYHQPVVHQYQQPVNQQYPQPVVHQYQQPVNQQYPQPVEQKCLQPAGLQYQQHVQQNAQLVQQPVPQQNHIAPSANPVVVVQQRPTEAPGNMVCPHCRTTVVTTIEYKLGMLTWIIVGVLFIIGCWPCCLIPFCVSSCKDVQHSCPQCNNVLHVYRRM